MSTLPAAGYLTNAARTEGEAKAAFDDLIASIKQIPGAGVAETPLTIASGSITPPGGGPGIFKVDTEAAAAADDLTNIVQTNFPDGSLLYLRCTNAGRVVTVKHAAGGAGQFTLANSQDLVLNDVLQWVCLKRTGTLWEAVQSLTLLSPTLKSALVTADPLVALGVASKQYVDQKNFLSVMENGQLSVSMAGNAVTIALKGNDGNDPSSTNPVRITFRSATLTSSAFITRTITAALSTVISSGSTGGTLNATLARIYVGAMDNAGTVELYWYNPVSGVTLFAPSENDLLTTTAEGGAGAADSAQVPYSTTARASLAHRVLGYFEATEATAGTWATSASKLQLMGPGVPRTGDRLQTKAVTLTTATFTTTSTTMVDITGLTVSLTPASAVNLIKAEAHVSHCNSSAALNSFLFLRGSTGIFCGATAGSRTNVSAEGPISNGSYMQCEHLSGIDNPNSAASVTYKMQARVSSGTMAINRSSTDTDSAAFARGASIITLEELCA